MKKKKMKESDITVNEAYILYRVRSAPALWKILDSAIIPKSGEKVYDDSSESEGPPKASLKSNQDI